jgi:hypothetical protein
MRGVQVLEAAYDEGANIPDFIKRFKPNFPVGTISRDFMANYAQITPMMRVFVPVMFFIDRKGVIQAQYFGGDPFFNPETATRDHVKAELDKMLKQDAPGSAKKSSSTKK